MICVYNLCKHYDDKILFNNFSFTINDGEFLVLTGKSGCGKTTLLNILAGLEPFEEGDVIVNGKSIKSKRNLKSFYLYDMGFLFQSFALIDNLTVKENLEIVQKKARSGLSIENVLEKVEMKRDIDTKVYKLSGGEQQRIALARLLYKQCNIIFADEPTGSLDKMNAENVMKILYQLNQEGKTVVVVTHDSTFFKYASRIIKLDE